MPNATPNKIPEPRIPPGELPLKFSFKHLDLESAKFHVSKCSTDYLYKLFAILRKFSTWRVEEFTDENNDEHRHWIHFPDTSEQLGFQNIPNVDSDQFGYESGYQFGVYPEVAWNRYRAHGILIDDTFFLVWLDPDHLLFPNAPAAIE
jgi:hypothetical protein